jgi:hypothetical protein
MQLLHGRICDARWKTEEPPPRFTELASPPTHVDTPQMSVVGEVFTDGFGGSVLNMLILLKVKRITLLLMVAGGPKMRVKS